MFDTRISQTNTHNKEAPILPVLPPDTSNDTITTPTTTTANKDYDKASLPTTYSSVALWLSCLGLFVYLDISVSPIYLVLTTQHRLTLSRSRQLRARQTAQSTIISSI